MEQVPVEQTINYLGEFFDGPFINQKTEVI